MIVIAVVLLIVGLPMLLAPHQLARLGRPTSRSGRARYDRETRSRGLPAGADPEDFVSRRRERVIGGAMIVAGVVLIVVT